MKAADWLDLPPLIVNKVYVDLPGNARALYEQLEHEMFLQLGDFEVDAKTAADLSQKCLQIASGALYVGDPTLPGERQYAEMHDAKIEALKDIVDEMAGQPIMVAYHWKHDYRRLMKVFPKARTLRANSQQDEDDWNAGKIAVLLAHPASMGHGLNLQYGGNTIAFFSNWWNLEEHDQIIERIGPTRQVQAGLNRPVIAHYIITNDTVDEDVVARVETKASVQSALRSRFNRRRH
jgi:hypothetical protein